MAAMDRSDRILATFLVISFGSLCYFAPRILQYAKDQARVDLVEEEPVRPPLQEDCEAAISLDALEVLANGPSYPLASSAIRIAARRLTQHPKSVQKLWSDLAGDDCHSRDLAIQTLQLLFIDPTFKDIDSRQSLLDIHACHAIVTALVKLLPEHCCVSEAESVSPVAPLHRPAQEVVLLTLLNQLLEHNSNYGYTVHKTDFVRPLIDAGIVTRYLQHYPFPCALAAYNNFNFKKHDVCMLLHVDERGTDDMVMSKLVSVLAKSLIGNQQLIDVGLKANPILDSTPRAPRRRDADAQALSQTQIEAIFNGEVVVENPSGEVHPRGEANMTAAERSRQRRHRQAVVVSDSDGTPNLLERQPTATELGWRQHS